MVEFESYEHMIKVIEQHRVSHGVSINEAAETIGIAHDTYRIRVVEAQQTKISGEGLGLHRLQGIAQFLASDIVIRGA